MQCTARASKDSPNAALYTLLTASVTGVRSRGPNLELSPSDKGATMM